MKYLPTVVCVAVPVVLTVASGLLYGSMSHRWGPSHDTLAAVRRLQEIPSRFGKWQLRSTEELDPKTLGMLACAGYFVRLYEDTETGKSVKVAILLGPPGPISVHVPEICFPSHNYTQEGERAVETIRGDEGVSSTFWGLTFAVNSLEGDRLRVCYAWSVDGNWRASASPRTEFAGSPYLCKIQLVAPLAAGEIGERDETCVRFLTDFVPVARRYLGKTHP